MPYHCTKCKTEWTDSLCCYRDDIQYELCYDCKEELKNKEQFRGDLLAALNNIVEKLDLLIQK